MGKIISALKGVKLDRETKGKIIALDKHLEALEDFYTEHNGFSLPSEAEPVAPKPKRKKADADPVTNSTDRPNFFGVKSGRYR